MIRIDRLEALVYRYPLATPVQTSFGLMQDRPMVVVKLTGRDGVIGWGEMSGQNIALGLLNMSSRHSCWREISSRLRWPSII